MSPNQMLPVWQPAPFSSRPWIDCRAEHQERGRAWLKRNEQCTFAEVGKAKIFTEIIYDI